MWLKLLLINLIVLVRRCSSFELTDEEYDRLPRLFSLDDYHNCLRLNGTYCMLRLDLFAEDGNELMQLIQNYSQHHHVKHFNYTYLERGVCVSETCRPFIGERDLADDLQLHQVVQECSDDSLWREYGLHARVTSQQCEHRSRPLRADAADRAALAFFLLILALNLVATAYDCLVQDDDDTLSKGRRMLLCFSLIRNFKYLVSPGSDDVRNNLRGINAVRNAGSFAVVIAHAAFALLGGFVDNPHDIEKSAYKVHYEVIWYGSYAVQIFFVIASLLLVYNLEKANETHQITIKSFPKLLFLRFLRLAPPLAVMLLFSSTWLRHLSSGPLWGRSVLSVSNHCRKYWWTHLLFINNYVRDNIFCALHTWHLAADTQLFVMGLLVYLLTRQRGRNVALAVLLLLGSIIPAYQVWKHNLDLVFFFSPEMSRRLTDKNFLYIHKPAHMNIAGYAIGMYAGYKMYEWEKKGITFQNKKAVTVIRVSVVTLMVVLSHVIKRLNTDDVSLGVRMAYQAVTRLIVAPAVALLLMTVNGQPGTENGILYWNIWNFLGRISYSVYLTHMNILHMLIGIRTQLDHFHYLNFVTIQLGFYLLSLILAIPFFLMVEAPLSRVMGSSTINKRLKKDDKSKLLEENARDVCTNINGIEDSKQK